MFVQYLNHWNPAPSADLGAIVIHSLDFLQLFHALTCSATSLNHPFREREQSPFHYYFQINHVFWPQGKLTTALNLPSLFLLAALVRTAGLSGQSTSSESQNPHSRWGHSSSRFRNWSSDSVHPEDSVQRQHSVNNSSLDKHCHGLWQVSHFPKEEDKPHSVSEQQFHFCLFLFNPQSFASIS